MGFYYNGSYETTLNIENLFSYNLKEEYIEIINNDEITFNFQNFKINNFNVDYLYKIVITYNDKKKIILKPFNSDDNNWLIFKDIFSHDNAINEKEDNLYPIKIDFYNLLGQKTGGSGKPYSMVINYKIKKQSFQSLGIELELVSANITNEKEISYVFKDLSRNQLFLAKSKKNMLK